MNHAPSNDGKVRQGHARAENLDACKESPPEPAGFIKAPDRCTAAAGSGRDGTTRIASDQTGTFRVTRLPIAGSEMLSRPVSMRPAKRYWKVGSCSTVMTRSYQPWNSSNDQSNTISSPWRVKKAGTFFPV